MNQRANPQSEELTVDYGYAAALVGESLLSAPDPSEAIAAISRGLIPGR